MSKLIGCGCCITQAAGIKDDKSFLDRETPRFRKEENYHDKVGAEEYNVDDVVLPPYRR